MIPGRKASVRGTMGQQSPVINQWVPDLTVFPCHLKIVLQNDLISSSGFAYLRIILPNIPIYFLTSLSALIYSAGSTKLEDKTHLIQLLRRLNVAHAHLSSYHSPFLFLFPLHLIGLVFAWMFSPLLLLG